MTEQEKTSAVVEDTREAVDTTPQPVVAEKKSKNSTALILSAVLSPLLWQQASVCMAGVNNRPSVRLPPAMPWQANSRRCKKPGEPKSRAGRHYQATSCTA